MKKFISFVLACLILVLCCGCNLFKKNTYVDITEKPMTDEGIVFYTENDTYPQSVKKIECVFCYEGDARGIIITSDGFYKRTLHKLVDGVWKEVNYRDGYEYQLIYFFAGFFEAGEPIEFRISTDCFETPLEKGTYRVATRAFVPIDDTYFEDGEFLYEKFGNGRGFLLVSEPFTIE